MAFIELPDVQDVDGEAAEMFAADQRALGYVANLTRLFALRPAVYQAWRQLSEAVRANVALAAAARCFFSTVLEAMGTEPDAAYRAEFEPGLHQALAVGRPIPPPPAG
jgi:hypothetical protein